MLENNHQIKSGIVALVGPPNVGKSTLLNNLMGQKISIVSPKPQTTRNRILGIINGPDHQIVILDTPGLHKSGSPFNQEMVGIALETISEVDAVLLMVDINSPLPSPRNENLAAKYLKDTKIPTILLINKIDLIDKKKLLPLIKSYGDTYPFTDILPISALKGDGADLLIKELLKLLPTGPKLYPEDIPTDSTERFIVAEMIREKIFLLTGQEIPYATAVMIDSFQEDEVRGLITLHATIFVEKNSQKGIIIGKKGSKLQEIGKAARRDIETLLDQKVMLKLWVKVKKNWTTDSRFLEELGFEKR